MKIVCASLLTISVSVPATNVVDARKAFAQWKITFNKQYATPMEEKKALSVFIQNDRIIHEHNRGGLSYTLGHNEFSDMTTDDFISKRTAPLNLAHEPPRHERSLLGRHHVAVPDSIDWTTKGAVTPVRGPHNPLD